jgi:hypothetical protein
MVIDPDERARVMRLGSARAAIAVVFVNVTRCE